MNVTQFKSKIILEKISTGAGKKLKKLDLFLVLTVTYCGFPQYGQSVALLNLRDFMKVVFQPHFWLQF